MAARGVDLRNVTTSRRIRCDDDEAASVYGIGRLDIETRPTWFSADVTGATSRTDTTVLSGIATRVFWSADVGLASATVTNRTSAEKRMLDNPCIGRPIRHRGGLLIAVRSLHDEPVAEYAQSHSRITVMNPRCSEWPAKSPPTPAAYARRRRILATSLGSKTIFREPSAQIERPEDRPIATDNGEPALKRRDRTQLSPFGRQPRT